MLSRRAISIVASIVGVLIAVALLGALTTKAHSHLSISLDAPHICESVQSDDGSVELVDVGWSVTGGTMPYESTLNGRRLAGSNGIVSLPCGPSASTLYSSHQTPGIVTLQFTVSDANGNVAAALHDLHIVQVIEERGTFPVAMEGPATYRVHGHLLTVPVGYQLKLGKYVSADCPTFGPDCADRFVLYLEDPTTLLSVGSITIYRWTGIEHSRLLDGSSGRSAMEIHADNDDAVVPWYQQEVNDVFDQLMSTIGVPPASRADVRSGGLASGRLRIKLTTPAICEAGYGGQGGLPVGWSVSGGRGPFEVTIAGDRSLGRTGEILIACTSLGPAPGQSGVRTIHATVVDARSDIAVDRADQYVIRELWSWAFPLAVGETYRYGNQLFTVPPDVQAETRRGTEHCVEDAVDNQQTCELSIVIDLSAEGERTSIEIGELSGAILSQTLAADAAPILKAKQRQLIASLGQGPALSRDFLDRSGPLKLQVFASPPVCSSGWTDLYINTRGGRWFPLRFTIDDEPLRVRGVGSRSASIYCESSGPQFSLGVRDSGPTPRSTTQSLNLQSGPNPYQSDLFIQWTLPQPRTCVVGKPFELSWSTSTLYSSPDQSNTVVRFNLDDRTFGPSGTGTFRCPSTQGYHLLEMRVSTEAHPTSAEYRYSAILAQLARPQR